MWRIIYNFGGTCQNLFFGGLGGGGRSFRKSNWFSSSWILQIYNGLSLVFQYSHQLNKLSYHMAETHISNSNTKFWTFPDLLFFVFIWIRSIFKSYLDIYSKQIVSTSPSAMVQVCLKTMGISLSGFKVLTKTLDTHPTCCLAYNSFWLYKFMGQRK